MSNIAAELNTTVRSIDRWYEKNNVQRTRLGLSDAGHECDRFLWYAHHGAKQNKIDGRVLRLFELGNMLEEQTIEDLKKVGVIHHSAQSEVSFYDSGVTLYGHIDGIVENVAEHPGEKMLFEHKTCSQKSFNKLLKCEKYREWNEIYWYQVQIYMVGLGLERAMIVVYCKDNSELKTIFVDVDVAAVADKLTSVFSAILQEKEPDRLCPAATWYKAKMCRYYDLCFGKNKGDKK